MSDGEYQALRSELLHSYTIVDSSRNILYVTVSCMLAFAVTNDDIELYLLPFSVIIPVYLIAINYTYDMYRIGTYISVFGEGPTSDYKWESRQLVLNKQKDHSMPRQAKMFHVPYISLGTACIYLFCLSFDFRNLSLSSFLCLIFGIFLYFLLIAIFRYYGDMLSVQKKYLEGWMNVKDAESDNIDSVFTPSE